MKDETATPQAVTRPKGAITVHGHKELYRTLDRLLKEKRKTGTKAPKSVSQFFERMAVRIIRDEGRKYGLKLPADLASE